MTKDEFIYEINPILQKMGYRKRGAYWYRSMEDHIRCINVQGSQWDKCNYYVNIGISLPNETINPTILHWYFQHRCKGEHGEVNISPQDMLAVMNNTFENISSISQIASFLEEHNAIKIASQFHF